MSTTAIAKKPLRQVSNVRELLMNDMAKSQLATVAAKHMRPERMMRLMANALRTTPQLAECEPLTLLGAMMTSASLGLEPNTPLGHAYLIPFRNSRKNVVEVQFIIGYKGMISLARRSGAVVNIHADVVYEHDEFSYEYGSNQHLTHRPKGARENPVYAYCHAKLTDGEAFIVLPWDVIIETRDNSQGWKTAVRYGKTESSPWGQHIHAMAKKTAVRRLFDELPISIEEVSDGVTVDEQRNDFQSFAFDPSAGVPSAQEGDVIDGEAVDQGEDEQPDEPEQEKTPVPKPAPKKDAPRKPKPEPKKPEPEPEPEGDDTGEQSDGEPDIPPKTKRLLDDIREALLDGAGRDACEQLFSEEMDRAIADDPAAQKAIQDLFAEYDE